MKLKDDLDASAYIIMGFAGSAGRRTGLEMSAVRNLLNARSCLSVQISLSGFEFASSSVSEHAISE